MANKTDARVELTVGDLAAIMGDARNRLDLWTAILNRLGPRTMAEIGVYRGDFAAHVLDTCPTLDRYYMIDPWRHLDDWNKPANRADDTFQQFLDETLDKTGTHASKRVVLRGRTSEVIAEIPDGSLDFVYVDGDHTLRGITVDLVSVYPKVREGGWIGGDDFSRSIWQHGPGFEPTLVFPYAVYFAEAVGVRIYGLSHAQFLLEKRRNVGFEFVDLTGRYGRVDLLAQMRPPQAASGGPARSSDRRARARRLLRRLRRRVRS
jgi:hypothetical protein